MITLLSGGIDSLLTLHYALQTFGSVKALLIDWKQPAFELEKIAATKICEHFGQLHSRLELKLLTIKNIGDGCMNRAGPNVVADRNYEFLRMASQFSSVIGIGCNADDYDIYEDCRRETLNEYEKKLSISIFSPVIFFDKRQIIARAISLKLPIDFAFSCYDPVNDRECGVCFSCREIITAMNQ